MNEYRVQRLKEELTYAQQRNKHQKKQLANYKNVHEKDLKEIERQNNIINELEKWLKENNERLHKAIGRKCVTQESYEEVLDKIKELKGEDKE